MHTARRRDRDEHAQRTDGEFVEPSAKAKVTRTTTTPVSFLKVVWPCWHLSALFLCSIAHIIANSQRETTRGNPKTSKQTTNSSPSPTDFFENLSLRTTASSSIQ